MSGPKRLTTLQSAWMPVQTSSTHQAKSIWASLTFVATFSCSFTAFHLVAWFPVGILLISLAFSFSCLALLDADTLAYFRSFNFFTDV